MLRHIPLPYGLRLDRHRNFNHPSYIRRPINQEYYIFSLMLTIIICCLKRLRVICLRLCGISTAHIRPILMSNVIDPDILFQGRYKAILVDIDEYAKELSRYIHLNPVRAKIVETPEEYEWSSYPAYTGKQKPAKWLYRDFILGYFGQKVSTAQKGYQEFVTALVHQEYDSPLDEVVSSTLLGSADFIAFIKDNFLSAKKPDRELPALKELIKKNSIQDIFEKVELVFNKDKVMARNVKMYLCQSYTGQKLKDIGLHFGIGESGVSQACRRVAQKVEKDKKLKKKIVRLEKQIKLSRMKSR